MTFLYRPGVSAMFQVGSSSDIYDSYEGSEDSIVPYYASILNGPYFGYGLQFLMGRTFAKVTMRVCVNAFVSWRFLFQCLFDCDGFHYVIVSL